MATLLHSGKPAAEAAAGDRPKANPVVATIATMSGVQAWGHLRD